MILKILRIPGLRADNASCMCAISLPYKVQSELIWWKSNHGYRQSHHPPSEAQGALHLCQWSAWRCSRHYPQPRYWTRHVLQRACYSWLPVAIVCSGILCIFPMPPSENFQFRSTSYFENNHDITGKGLRSNSLKEPLSKGVTITFHVHPEAHYKQLSYLLNSVCFQ